MIDVISRSSPRLDAEDVEALKLAKMSSMYIRLVASHRSLPFSPSTPIIPVSKRPSQLPSLLSTVGLSTKFESVTTPRVSASAGKHTRTGSAVFSTSRLCLFIFCVCCAIYRKAGGVPNWILLLLLLSKRLHSIYVLRLFNDVQAVVFAHLSILALGGCRSNLAVLLLR